MQHFELLPDANFRHYVDSEVHHYKWEKLLSYTPQSLHGYANSELVSIIKEALIVEGGGVLDNKDYPNCVVEFNF
ncbi:hypothetical protein F975_02064 [Acinetobacter sp. ANC 3789]|uniref:hypothetical protein n=1 Tax=Acinetobacter sp. ANC 3789 TaxID=1217714 RepID=UPI0002CEF75A|nr:hypothetical protein [Acinetobacter sp. ANC 3789]ENU80308.1 hypothetical protein F975_02064 [Acinetobacter sp. ANC 3789]